MSEVLKRRSELLASRAAAMPPSYGDGIAGAVPQPDDIMNQSAFKDSVVGTIQSEIDFLKQASGLKDDQLTPQEATTTMKDNLDGPIDTSNKAYALPPIIDPALRAYRDRIIALQNVQNKVKTTNDLSTIKDELTDTLSNKTWNEGTGAKTYADAVRESAESLAFIQGIYDPSSDSLINQRNIMLYTILHGDQSKQYNTDTLERLTDGRSFKWWRDDMRRNNRDDKELMRAINKYPNDSSKWPDRVREMYVSAINSGKYGLSNNTDLDQTMSLLKSKPLGEWTAEERQKLETLNGAYVIEKDRGNFLVRKGDPQWDPVDAKRFQDQRASGGNGYYDPPKWLKILEYIGLGLGIVALAATGVGAVVGAMGGAAAIGVSAGTATALSVTADVVAGVGKIVDVVAGIGAVATDGGSAASIAGLVASTVSLGASAAFSANEFLNVTKDAFPVIAESTTDLSRLTATLAKSPSLALAEATDLFNSGALTSASYIEFVNMSTSSISAGTEVATSATTSIMSSIKSGVIKAIPGLVATTAAFAIEQAFDVHPALGILLEYGVAELSVNTDSNVLRKFASEMISFSDNDADVIGTITTSIAKNLSNSEVPLSNRVASKLTEYLADALLKNPSKREIDDRNWSDYDLSPAQVTSLTYQKHPPQNILSGGNVYDLVHHDPYMNAYADEKTRKIIVSVRGTKLTDMKDIKADISLPINKLVASQRYQKDTKTLRDIMRRFDPSEWDYVLTGHSLGGAIVSELTREYPILGLAGSGSSTGGGRHTATTFNSAIQPEDIISRTGIKRHYTSDDPLYKTGGFLTPGHKNKRAKTERSLLRAHALDNFY